MIEITAPGKKTSVVVESPVLFGAGFAGFDGSPVRKLLALDKFGALVTPPLTLEPRHPANGPRVVPLPAGFLLHTGLPNPGVNRALRDYERKWDRSILPIIVHLVAESPESVAQAVRIIDRCEAVAGIELGLHDEIVMRELSTLLKAAIENTDLPVMVRLPLYSALVLSEVAEYGGADALIVSAPPRGTARYKPAGRLIGGRVYGPWLKSQVLRMVGRIMQYTEIPVIACGGIHTPDDARDFIVAGATAVQLDSVVWQNPKMAEEIARNLGGTELTRTAGALSDEWEPGADTTPPPDLPEMPPAEDMTDPYDDSDQQQWTD